MPLDVASPGDLGCIEVQNHVLATLKENYHHEVIRSKPSNFTVIEVSKTGTTERITSINEVNSILYFYAE